MGISIFTHLSLHVRVTPGNHHAFHAETLAEYFVDTEDNALLHLACLIDPSVHNERVLASTQPYNWNQILGISRQVYPNRKFIDDIPDQGTDLSTVGNERTREIIQHMGKEGLTSLETSIQLNVQDL